MYAQGMESKRGGEGRGGEGRGGEKREEGEGMRREERREKRVKKGLLTPCSPLLSIESAGSCCSPHT